LEKSYGSYGIYKRNKKSWLFFSRDRRKNSNINFINSDESFIQLNTDSNEFILYTKDSSMIGIISSIDELKELRKDRHT
jgi:hypothetical protein